MSNSAERQSLRELAGTIRHLDATRAREVVAAFGKPCAVGHYGWDAGDEVVTSAGGCVTLGCETTRGVTAETVAHWKTHLHLHGLLRLPLTVARELAKHPGHVYLDKVAAITDAVAYALREHAGGCLSLDNLRAISGQAAGALGGHAGDLSLNGLTQLPLKVALGLSQHSAELHLNGLSELEPRPTAVLCRHRGHLHLNGLRSLAWPVSLHLARYRGRLHLHGLASLSDEVAAEFGGRVGHLCVPGIARLTARQAELLSGHHGALHLGRVRLDDATAHALGRHRGSLFIRLPHDIPPHRLDAIVRHQGPLEISGLADLNEAQARVLATQAGPRELQGLSCLFIDTVSRITPAVAAILASHNGGGLCLTDIRELDVDVARELVKHPILALDSIAGISDEVAAILAAHTGTTLSLRGLRHASHRATALLQATPSVELPLRLRTPCESGGASGPGDQWPAPSAGIYGDDLIDLLRRIARQGELVLRQAADREDDAI
ncbi:MAG: hypothetical protein FJ286_14260 [Planctomycetes bacterium]|nr:hypothetical protein [Planctomycetota bacterium]